jgi:NADP-dependent 3-hydroxy acid dehydrogenase YdfG
LKSLFDLSGKVALVTGASSGIGQQQSQALALAGASVVLLGRRQEQLLSTVADIEALGGKAAALALDLNAREVSTYASRSMKLPSKAGIKRST